MDIENSTSFEAEAYPIQGKQGEDQILILVKSTFSFDENTKLTLSEEQESIQLADEYWDKPNESSLKYASDFSLDKQSTDIAMIGTFIPSDKNTKQGRICLQVGNLKKEVLVFGKRYWKQTLGIKSVSEPEPIEKIELTAENAFGGVDTNSKTNELETFEENPFGKGFQANKTNKTLEETCLPHLENPNQLIKSIKDKPTPTWFGFIDPTHPLRQQYIGTYDAKWEKERMPLLPEDFNTNFFNTAQPDLTYAGFLQGLEEVVIEGMLPKEKSIHFFLPQQNPSCMIDFENQTPSIQPELSIHKLFLDIDTKKVILVWGTNFVYSHEMLENAKVMIYQDILNSLQDESIELFKENNSVSENKNNL